MIYIISLNTWKVDQTVREFVTVHDIVSDLTVFLHHKIINLTETDCTPPSEQSGPCPSPLL